MGSREVGMTSLGKGRLAYTLVVLLAATDFRGTEAHPVGEPQQDGVSDVSPSDLDYPFYDYTYVDEGADYEVYPDLLQQNGTSAVGSKGEKDFLEMDPKMLGEVLEFLDVESLDRQDPALENPGGLEVMTNGGDHLKVTRGQDGSISVNGSVVDGVMSLPDGTEIYTLERFLEEHRHLMDEAFKQLTAQPKSLEQTNGQNFVTKQQPTGNEVEKFQVDDQVSKPLSSDIETAMPFSVSVSEVTEISTRTSPPQISDKKSAARDITVTKVPNEDSVPTEEQAKTEIHQTQSSQDQSPHDEVYHEELYPEYPTYEDAIHSDRFPEYPLYDDVLYEEHISKGATQGKEIPEYPVIDEPTYEDVVFVETSSLGSAVSGGNVNETVPTDEVLDETHHEEIPVTELPLELQSHHSEPLAENVNRKAKEILSESELSQISANTEKTIILEEVTEMVPIQTTFPALKSDLHEDDLIPVTETIKEETLNSNPVLNSEEPIPLVEHSKNITIVPETDLPEVEDPVTEHFFEEDPLPVTELGPFPSEVVTEYEEEESLVNATSPLENQELQAATTYEVHSEIHIGSETISKTFIDSPVQTELLPPTETTDVTAEQTELLNPLPRSDVVHDDGTSKIALPRHIDSQAHDINLDFPVDITPEDQETTPFIVPAIPPVISEIDILPIIDVWGFALLEQENDTKINVEDNKVPRTILTPEFHEFVNVVPQDSWHPLYDSNSESKGLRKEFVLDYLVEDPILPDDPRMATKEGLNVSNTGGKELSFRRDNEGYVSINGIPVLDFSTLSDGTATYTLATFLFDHRALVKNALLRHSRLRIPDLSADVPGPPLDILDDTDVLPVEPTIPTVTETMSTGAIPPSEEFPVTEALGGSPMNISEIPGTDDNPVSITDIQDPIFEEELSLHGIDDHPVPTEPILIETDELQASFQGDEADKKLLIQRTLPLVPETVAMGRHSSLLQFWELSLEDQDRLSIPANEVGPRTLLNPDFIVVENLVPEGFKHPLLSNKTENKALRTEMVLDYLIPQPVTLKELKSAPAEGLHVTNLNGKDLVFEGKFGSGSKGQESRLTINGVDVTKIVTLADGTYVFELTDLLFDHRQRISELAHQASQDQGKSIENLLEETPLTAVEFMEPSLTVPAIPLPAAINPTASQTHLWAYNQFYQDQYHNLDDVRFPKTILSPDYKRMESLVPNDDRYPLYENSNQHSVDLRSEFLLNYLILESVDERDTRITQPGGLTVENLLGHNLTFSMDDQGYFTINGVLVEKIDTLDSDIKVYHLANFLFDHSEIQTLSDEYRASNTVTSSNRQGALPASSMEEVAWSETPVPNDPTELDVDTGRSQNLNQVPDIPDLIEDSGLSLINLWRFALRHQDLSFLIEEQKIPMTVISPINDKMQNMVPEDSPHPLYDDSPESVALRTEFLLDYLSVDRVSPNDTRIGQPDGLNVLNLNQKELVFSTDLDGNLMISGIPVEDVQTLPDGTHIYTLSDFLYDHKSIVNEALRKLANRAKNIVTHHSGAADQENFDASEDQV